MRTVPLLLLLAAPPAFAGSGAFGVKTMREPLPAHEVERSLLLPKGWLELELAYDRHQGVGAWTADGEKELFDSASWTWQTERATITYGLMHRWEMSWTFPMHQARLVNPALETDTRDSSPGDPHIGLRFEIVNRDPPPAIGSDEPVPPRKSSVAAELDYKGPAAKETPGTFIGGPLNVSGFVFTTGTPDLSLGIAAKHQLGPIALTGRLHYVRRFSAVVSYLVELENLQFAGRMKPGDQVRLDANVAVQAGPVVPFATLGIKQRFVTRIGTTAGSPTPNKNLDDVADSDGTEINLDAGVLLNATRGVDVALHAVVPLAGEDLQFFPIEDLQPTLGPTFGGSLQVRY